MSISVSICACMHVCKSVCAYVWCWRVRIYKYTYMRVCVSAVEGSLDEFRTIHASLAERLVLYNVLFARVLYRGLSRA